MNYLGAIRSTAVGITRLVERRNGEKMKKHFIILLTAFTLCAYMLMGLGTPSPVQAQDSEDIFTLEDLRDTDIQLAGPYDSFGLGFGIPCI